MNNIKTLIFSNSNDFKKTVKMVANAAISNIKNEDKLIIKVPEPKSPFWYREEDLLDRIERTIYLINPYIYINIISHHPNDAYYFEVLKDFKAFLDISKYQEGQLLLVVEKYLNQDGIFLKRKFVKVNSLVHALQVANGYDNLEFVDGELRYCYEFELISIEKTGIESPMDHSDMCCHSFGSLLCDYIDDLRNGIDTSYYHL